MRSSYVTCFCLLSIAGIDALSVRTIAGAGSKGPKLHSHQRCYLHMLDLSTVQVGDKIVVTGSDEYPKFFHVPGFGKEGYVAKGMTGTISKVYRPGESDHLDRSDERDVLVAFDGPNKAWKAHFALDEIRSADEEISTPVAATNEVDECDTEAVNCDRVESFMTPIADAILLSPDMPMRAAAELLSTNKITGAPVAENGKLVGVLTQFDFLYQEARGSEGFQITMDGKWADRVRKSLAGTVRSAMSHPTAIAPNSDMAQVAGKRQTRASRRCETCVCHTHKHGTHAHAHVHYSATAGLMLRKRFNHVPVVDEGGAIVGILTSQDVLRHVLARLPEN